MRASVPAVRAIATSGAAALVLALPACGGGLVEREPNLIAGKEAFVEKCGACHRLARAGTTGVSGPDLDTSFARALADGMRRSSVEGVVREQIDIPLRDAQLDPQTLERTVAMPADIVTGRLADDVAAYVAFAAARPGEDQGRLGEIGTKQSDAATEAEEGVLEIPAAPDGGLAYVFASATAPAGPLVIRSPNESSIPHNIALEGPDIDQRGEVVQDGGVSEIEVDVEPGEYTYYCSVPGHREGGMTGTLTVE